MKTRDEIINNGFMLMSTNTKGIEVWAHFTEWEDVVQFVYCKDEKVIGGLGVKSLSELMMYHRIYEGLTMGKNANKTCHIIPSSIWKETWKEEIFK